MIDVSERDREAFHSISSSKVVDARVKDSKSSLSIGKTFLYMFMYLVITAAVAFGVGALMYYLVGVKGQEEALDSYMALLIVSAILMFIDMIVINVVVIRGKHSMVIPGIIYAILMGALFSVIALVIDWKLIGLALAVTSLAYLLMAGIAFISKGNMRPLMIAIIGLGAGVGLIVLFNWIFILITGMVFTALYWLVTIGIFVLIMLVTIIDLWRMKQIADSGQMSNNMSLYFAFIMYTDFINIFIRVLYFLIIIYARAKK